MSKFNKEKEEVKKIEVSKNDVTTLQSKLEQFPQKELLGQLVSPFYQWCLFSGIIAWKDEQFVVQDPYQFFYWTQVQNKLENIIGFENKDKHYDFTHLNKIKMIHA